MPAPVILIVEDDVFIRFAAADLIASAGYEVIEADDAEAALRILDTGQPVALVFTDIDMPGRLDGLELAHHIHTHRPRIRIIITSGRHALGAGQVPAGGRFLPKPYGDETILQAIEGMLGNTEPAEKDSGPRHDAQAETAVTPRSGQRPQDPPQARGQDGIVRTRAPRPS